jgi:hypothetical protein
MEIKKPNETADIPARRIPFQSRLPHEDLIDNLTPEIDSDDESLWLSAQTYDIPYPGSSNMKRGRAND